MRFSQRGHVAVFVIVLVIIAAVLGATFYYLKYNHQNGNPLSTTPTASIVTQSTPQPSTSSAIMKTYNNEKYNFSIQYPSTLAVREFPNTKDGAGFRPADKSEDPQYEIITIQVLPKIGNMAKEPLVDYAKVAASVEIQGYQDQKSISEVKTNGGIIGYETTWVVTPPSILRSTEVQEPSVSLPITYFDLPGATIPSTVQVNLSDNNYADTYQQMIKTFAD